jgi:rSAM/selenodomain-associated transferase 1
LAIEQGQLKYPTARILIFAKAPVLNQVKTRLIPDLGVEKATQLYRLMLTQTVNMAISSQLCPVQLWCSPDSQHQYFQALGDEYPLKLFSQQGGNLGERMLNAASCAFEVATNVVLIGTDCLQLSESLLYQVLSQLENNNAEVNITPAHDGGYVALGMNQVRNRIFDKVDWGTARVMEQTRQALKDLAWNWTEELPLRDVDTIEDIKHILQNGHQYRLDTDVRELLERVRTQIIV